MGETHLTAYFMLPSEAKSCLRWCHCKARPHLTSTPSSAVGLQRAVSAQCSEVRVLARRSRDGGEGHALSLTFYLDCNFVVLGCMPTSEGSVPTQGQQPPMDLSSQPGVIHRCPALGQLLKASPTVTTSGPSLCTCLLHAGLSVATTQGSFVLQIPQ